MRPRVQQALLGILAALVAVLFSAIVTSLVLVATGHNPFEVLQQMVEYAAKPDQIATIINSSTTYYISAIAVAIGFRMNLFNIGVDGQYQLAALLAAAFGGAVTLPKGISQIAILLVAMLVGSAWAGLVGVLKVTRGVSEVISSIMLNFVATGIIAFLLVPGKLGHQSGNAIGTKPIPESAWVPGLSLIPGADVQIYGLVFLAIALGVAFHLVLSRSRFGFDLRATGRSATAARASGVNVKRMIIITMLISGAVAGLVNMPVLLGDAHNYSINTPSGQGFIGIAIALLGRNNPVGILFASLLWAFLNTSSNILQLSDVPDSVVSITQGVVVLSSVIAYEVVNRYWQKRQMRQVGRELAAAPAPEVSAV